jgi:GcrA cell cycle regulator
VTWTAERVETAKARWAEGYTSGQIAAELGITRNAVLGQISRQGLLKTDRAGKVARAPRAPRKPRAPKPPGLRVGRLALRTGQFMTAAANDDSIPLPPEPLPAPRARNVTLLELKPDDCRWPTGRTDEYPRGEALFCGDARHGGSSYCRYHLRIATRGFR